VEQPIETVPLNEEGVAQIDVQDGWNVVSNPLKADVQWSSVQEATGTNQPLWQWSGTWEQASTFRSATTGEAYYFRDDQVSELTVPFSASANAVKAKPRAKVDTASGGKQTFTLSVVRGDERMSSVAVGTRPRAEKGLDRYDQYGPPEYFGTATLRLVQGGNGREALLATEYRPEGREGQTYDLRLRAPADTAITLLAENLGAFSGEGVALVEAATGEAHDLRASRTVTIVPRSEKTRHRLLIGSETYLEEEKRAVQPSEVKLLPNYPNPFTEQTTIEYALPKDTEVRLSVYDVLGRRIATLVQGLRKAGFHRMKWEVGTRSPTSGTYFLRLRAGGEAEVRRVTLLR
jgi:hypothetical protein